MTPLGQINKLLAEHQRDDLPKPKSIALTHVQAEMLILEAMKRTPNLVKLKPGNIQYRGVRILVATEEQIAEMKAAHKKEHPIELPEPPKIILPEAHHVEPVSR